MAVAQDAYYIPDDIATGIATGIYKRFGSVVRHAVGPNKGQIVMHLKSIDLDKAEQADGIAEKALKFVKSHKKETKIVVLGAAAAAASAVVYKIWKNHEPRVLTEYRAALKSYIEAIKAGNMDVNIINELMTALDNLKKHKNYENFCIQLTAEDLEVLVGRVYEYTLKLASDNAIELTEEEMPMDGGVIIDLETCLKAQKRIFEEVA